MKDLRRRFYRESPKEFGCCSACRITKPGTEFYPNRGRLGGLSTYCKACQNARKDAKDAADPTKKNARTRASLARRPERADAVVKLGQAVKSGRVMRWPVCAVPECSQTKVQGHHPDYAQPLDVVWLCLEHHRKVHRMSKETA